MHDIQTDGPPGFCGAWGVDPINCVGISKGPERYIVLYSDRMAGEAYRQLGRWAHSPELTFDWRDAAKLAEKIRLNAVEAQ